MKIFILGGFLGSGKTTFLLQLAHYLADQGSPEKPYRLMIIENEIGSVGVDSALARTTGFGVRNLFSGCACCTLTGELVELLRRLEKEYAPDYLIVEASGVAMPGNICKTIQRELGARARTLVLADASRWQRLLKPLQMVIPNQLEGADVVLLNKVDLVDEQTLLAVKTSISELAPEARLLPLCAARPLPASLWELVTGGVQE